MHTQPISIITWYLGSMNMNCLISRPQIGTVLCALVMVEGDDMVQLFAEPILSHIFCI